MNTILLYIFGFIVVMTLILARLQNDKIKAIGYFWGIFFTKIQLLEIIKVIVKWLLGNGKDPT